MLFLVCPLSLSFPNSSPDPVPLPYSLVLSNNVACFLNTVVPHPQLPPASTFPFRPVSDSGEDRFNAFFSQSKYSMPSACSPDFFYLSGFLDPFLFPFIPGFCPSPTVPPGPFLSFGNLPFFSLAPSPGHPRLALFRLLRPGQFEPGPPFSSPSAAVRFPSREVFLSLSTFYLILNPPGRAIEGIPVILTGPAYR